MSLSKEDVRLALVVAREIRFTVVIGGVFCRATRSFIRGRTCTIVVRIDGEGDARRLHVMDFHWGLPDKAAAKAGLASQAS